MIDIENYIKEMEAEPEIKIKERILLAAGKTIPDNDYATLLEILKNHLFYADYITKFEYTEKSKIMFHKILSAFNINSIDEKNEYASFIANGKKENIRCSEWKQSITKLFIQGCMNTELLTVFTAKFKYCNRWGYATLPSEYRIVLRKNEVIWIKTDYRDPDYFIFFNRKYYGLSYENNFLTIFNDTNNIEINDIVLSNDVFDKIILEYSKKNRKSNDVKIKLADYFEWGFFHLRDKDRRSGKEYCQATYIETVSMQKNYLKIELKQIAQEANTCVHYFLLNIEKSIIVDSNTIKQFNNIPGLQNNFPYQIKDRMFEKDLNYWYNTLLAYKVRSGISPRRAKYEETKFRILSLLPDDYFSTDIADNFFAQENPDIAPVRNNKLAPKIIIGNILADDFDITPENYYSGLCEAVNLQHGEYLSQRKLSTVRKMRVFKVPGFTAGVALMQMPGTTEFSEIVGLYNFSGFKYIGSLLFDKAVKEGGKYLECFGDFLRGLYMRRGFVVYKVLPNTKMPCGKIENLYFMKLKSAPEP